MEYYRLNFLFKVCLVTHTFEKKTISESKSKLLLVLFCLFPLNLILHFFASKYMLCLNEKVVFYGQND